MQDYTPDEEIDLLCDQFEREWQDGKGPSIDSYLERVNKASKPRLLYWLLTVQLQYSMESDEQKRQMLEKLRDQFFQFRNAVDDAASSLGNKPTNLPTIPGYTIKRHVQRGGQGQVYQATQNRTGQDVAIKLVSTNQLERIAKDDRIRVIARLEKEIRTAAGLNHPNIVKVFDAGESDSGFYFVMQWVKGGSLADRTTLSQTDAAKIVRSVADALAEAHASGVLHLDVKPHNILIDQSTGQPLLADFGLARLSQETTTSSAIAGTLGYMAPEQAQGAPLDVRADVYGLGATFYQLLTGRRPYQHVSLPYNDAQRDAWLPKSPRTIRSDVNPELERICTKCLSFDPDARFQSCEEVAAALDRFAFTEDGRRIARISARTLLASPLFFVINLVVTIQIIFGWVNDAALEPLVWITMFSMYAVVFLVFGTASKLDKHSPEYLAVESLWAIWLAKFFAAMAIAGSLRLSGISAEEAILMCYPMFSALTGLVLATMAPRYWRPLYGFAVIAWGNSLLLTLTVVQGLTVAPAIYGALATTLTTIWGIKLRRLSREQAPAGAPQLEPTVDFTSKNA